MGRQINNMKQAPLPLLRNEEVIQQQPDQRGITERYVDESLQFIRREKESPFFLYLAHMYVHVRYLCRNSFSMGRATGPMVVPWRPSTGAMASIDAELERLTQRKCPGYFHLRQWFPCHDEGEAKRPTAWHRRPGKGDNVCLHYALAWQNSGGYHQ